MSDKGELEAAIAALEAQRAVLGDAVVDVAVGPMREKLAALSGADTPALPADDGERKFVTMIFADLSGSTALGEVMDPEEIRDLLNGCFDRLVPRVKEFGGTIDKFIGDNVMALFGAPVAHENDPERALRAALGMMEALSEFNTDMGVELGIHIGVNSGLVIAGGVGSEGDRRYSVLGDAVNVAARLESASETGEILVGPDTRRLAGPAFEYVDLEPISVKGREEPVAVSRLVGVGAGRFSGRGIEGLSSSMVGRDSELACLVSMVDGVGAARGGVVAVVADAGVGKSRFVAEAKTALPDGGRWVQGSALAHTVSVPYSLVRDLVRDLLGVAPDADLDEVSGSLVRELTLGMSSEEVAAEWPFLARLLDLPLSGAAAAVIAQYDRSPEILVQRTADAFLRLITAALSSPAVIVWEDLHWADASSLKLLESLLPLTDTLPLLLVMVFRPRDSAVSSLHRSLTEDEAQSYEVIELLPLSPGESESLVDGLLRIENFPSAMRGMLLSKAEGNPLFLEELVRSLIDSGFVVVGVDGAVATDAIHELGALDLPDTVHGVIGARIDQLPSLSKAVLQSASVLGRVFDSRVLTRLASREVEHDLGELRRLDFVTLKGESKTTEYLFRHVFTQEAAYNGMLLAQRRELHAVAASAIEVLFGDQLEEFSATLAGHYEAAHMNEPAAQHFLVAARRAAAAFANDDALNLTDRGLELVGPDDARTHADLLLVRERLNHLIGDRDSQLEDLTALENLADSLSDDDLRLEAALRHTDRYEGTGDIGAALDKASEARDLSERIGSRSGVIRADLAIGWGNIRQSNLDVAARHLSSASDLAESEGEATLQMSAVRYLGAVAFGRRDFLEARRLGEEALRLAERDGQLLAVANLHQNLGVAALPVCDFDYSREHFNLGLQIGRKLGSRGAELACLFGLSEVLFFEEDYIEALEHAEKAESLARSTDSQFWVGATLRARAGCLMALDRLDEAVEACEESVRIRRTLGSLPHLMDVLAVLARAKAALQGEAAAMQVAEEVVDFLLNGGTLDGGAYPFRVYSSCLTAMKATDHPRFGDLLAQAGDLFAERYPSGGCLPWHDDLRHILASA